MSIRTFKKKPQTLISGAASPPRIKLLTQFAWWASTPSGLIWLFAIGALIRLVLIIRPGFQIDMSSFRGWTQILAERGPSQFYPPLDCVSNSPGCFFVDYAPGWLYVLWFMGLAHKIFLTPLTFLGGIFGVGAPSDFLLKLPIVFFDLALAALVVKVSGEVTSASHRGTPYRGLAAAAILLNPALLLAGPLWGQVDVAAALAVLAALYLAGSHPVTLRKEMAGAALLAVAIATKPQSVFVVPIFVTVLAWRHIRGSYAQSGRSALPFGFARVLGVCGFGLASGLIILLPFGLTPLRALAFYQKASDTYQVTSVNAFNLWGAIEFWKPDTGPDAVSFIFSALTVGWFFGALLGLVVLVLCVRALRKGVDELRVMIFGGAALFLVAFSVVTRIHERYLYTAVALLAPLVAYRYLRRAFVALSVLYGINVFYAFGYYQYFYDKEVPKAGLATSIFKLLYGSAGVIGATNRVFWSVLTAGLCLAIAFFGWTWLRSRYEGSFDKPHRRVVASAHANQGMRLHPVGLKGAVAGFALFAVALSTRLVGLETPPGMYFDEVYHARTAGEYIQGQPDYEYTHPPLGKEIMALTTRFASGTSVLKAQGALNDGGPVASDGTLIAFAGPDRRTLGIAQVDDGCQFHSVSELEIDGQATAIALNDATISVGSTTGVAALLTHFEGSNIAFETPLPSVASRIVHHGDSTWVVGSDGTLTFIDKQGISRQAGVGAAWVTEEVEYKAGPSDAPGQPKRNVVWISFPLRLLVVAYASDGTEVGQISTKVEPGSVVVPDSAGRLVVASEKSAELESTDLATRAPADRERVARGADEMISLDRTGLIWATSGTRVLIVEPLGMAILKDIRLPGFPSSIAPAGYGATVVVSIEGSGLYCVESHIPFGWRVGNAVTGAGIILMTFLLGLRIFGSSARSLFAAALILVCGLSFTMSRMAGLDTYATFFMLSAWYCALGCLYQLRARPPDPLAATSSLTPDSPAATSSLTPDSPASASPVAPADAASPKPARNNSYAIGWLFACGLVSGAALATKWVGLYTIAAIGVVFIYDAIARRRDGVAMIGGHPVTSALMGLAALVAVPLVVYLLTYIPFFQLDNSFADFVDRQQGMYSYHSTLNATHPFGSAWYAWPFGNKAIYLHLFQGPNNLQEQIFTAANPFVLIGGLVGLGALAVRYLRRREVNDVWIVWAAAAQFLPWVLISRVAFLYHYLPVVPFLCLAMARTLESRSGRFLNRAALTIFLLAAVAFVLQLPILDGWLSSEGRLNFAKFARWMF